MSVEIVYPSEKFFPSFHETLDAVAREKIYIEMIEAPPFEKVAEFQRSLVEKGAPVYYAIEGEKVVGWCDISRSSNPRFAHRGGLGMGLLPARRSRGIGSRLMKEALDHAKRIGLEKVELHVYADNLPAIALYEKHGFEREGLIRNFRKLEGRSFDCLAMAKFL